MGGGDLNLKKSWHPQTLRNVEKVWKAEQKHEAERKKIEELQRELREERAREEMQKYAEDTGAVKKRDEKLDWMYQGPGGMVNREEYLLGRPVDKFILDKMQDPESGPSTETGLLPGSIFTPSAASSTLDIANKIREDPLFMIRKKEDEQKREFLKNPVKMKMIREMLQTSLDKKSKKKKRKKEKEKKKKKERRKSSSSEEDSSSVEDERAKHSRSHKKYPRSPSPQARQKVPGFGLQVREEDYRNKRNEPSEQDRHRHYSRSPLRDSKGSKSREEGTHRPCPRSSPSRHEERYRRQRPSGYTKKLTAEELERRRLEMMEDARNREVERESNVRRYKQEEETEKEKEQQRKESKFLHQMKLESAATSSVEDRVKRKIHGIQRTASALEKNFMKR
ncbi:pre-mRNA-splicing factor CWC25 homolog isoform X2 [Bombina bombina]|uniref:pre-mRNA-splicing factor CWC25 homolog isoform X2 n=1 Tax=Bombina bombina TaxID=8345 RepID=UPI00235A77BA|nr:pre-mRNA-splicing factor CWC25 homolog isoform X2 [Bombina bombina]